MGSDKCYNMDKSGNHYDKWNDQDQKDKYCMTALMWYT